MSLAFNIKAKLPINCKNVMLIFEKFTILKNKFFIAFLAGAFCVFAFAPFQLFFTAIISISAFYYFLEKKTDKAKQAFYLGFFYGFGYFLAGIHWIAISLLVDASSFAWLIPFALTLIPGILAIYFALMALCYFKITQKIKCKYHYQKILIFAILWLIFEILRANLFTGFPWNLIGYIWLFSINISQIANIFGIYGLSFFAVIICLFPALFFDKNPKKIDKIFAVILAILMVMSFFYGLFYIKKNNQNNISDINLRLVQGNIKQEMKWRSDEKYRNFIKHIELTNSRGIEDIDAVIWSETAIPYIVDSGDEDLMRELKKALPRKNNISGNLISGALRADFTDESKIEISQAYNSIVLIDENGLNSFYDKSHLVPFGEYLPFINKITDGAVGFGEGDGPKELQAKAFSFSPLVCYEIIFSNKIIAKNSDPDLIVNLTNDSWFGNSIGPYQHLASAQMRAIEYATSVARVANSGITAFIDPFGRIIDRIELNKTAILDVKLVKKNNDTIYQKFGNLLLSIIILVVVIILIFSPKNVSKSSNSN